MLTRLSPFVLCLASAVAPQGPPDFPDASLAPLGRAIATYLDARTQAAGVDEARALVARLVEEFRAQDGQRDPLRHPEVLARALRLGRDFDAAKLERGRVRSETFEGGSFGDRGLEVTFRLPKEYEPDARDYPLVLAIPGREESPAEHIRSRWMARDVRYEAIVVAFEMPAEVEGWDQVMVRGVPGGMAHVLSALRFALERFAVDPDRIFVAGRGAGVAAALAAGNYAPQRFAGVIGRVGDASELAPDNFRNLPTCFTVSGVKAEAFAAGAKAAGHDNVTRFAKDDEELVWEWIRAHPRVTYPQRIRLVTGDPFPTRVNWLRVAPSAPGAAASAAIDRLKNVVDITTEGVSFVTLYLNDELVDLEREVRVLCNGTEVTGKLERHVPSALDMLFDGTSDAGCLYVVRAGYDTTGADRRTERETEAQTVLRRLVREAPDEVEARRALGQWGEGDQWFSTKEAFVRYQQSQDAAIASGRGWVESKGVWIHPDERGFTNKNWFKDFATGQWLNHSDRRRLAEGWARQDFDWIAPDEAGFVDQGLWRVDGDWLELEAADRRHALLGSEWVIPRGEVVLHTTVDRHVALQAAEHMGRAILDLQLVFGVVPALPIDVMLLRDEEQYDRFAFGDPGGRRLPAHTGRLHSIHSGFFAESWRRQVNGQTVIQPLGVGYWDADLPNGDLYGVHSARLAVGLSYADRIDPSPKTLAQARARGLKGDYYAAYQAEKQLPAWLRTGGAVYAERYFKDRSSSGNPWWAREWSLDNLQRLGGLRELEQVLAFELDPDQREDGRKLLLEAGLLVAFLVDGGSPPVTAKHEEFKRAMLSNSLTRKHVEALEQALRSELAALRAFAGP